MFCNTPLQQAYLDSLFLVKVKKPKNPKNLNKNKEKTQPNKKQANKQDKQTKLIKDRPNLNPTSLKGICIWPSAAIAFLTSVGH